MIYSCYIKFIFDETRTTKFNKKKKKYNVPGNYIKLLFDFYHYINHYFDQTIK